MSFKSRAYEILTTLKEASVNKFIGIDLHSNNCVIVVTDEEDRVVFQKRLPNSLEEIRLALCGLCWFGRVSPNVNKRAPCLTRRSALRKFSIWH